ncbi:MAG: uracil-DNA glycosylase [Syntrophaceae bacterium]|nr:uracil-DNA glycosylase [Syntrophaceae bacterium]
MNFRIQTPALDQPDFLLHLRALVAGLRHYLEEERALGFEGWTKKSAPSPPMAPPGSQGPVVSPLSLEEVRRELGDCRRCKLHSGRTNIVFGTGNPKAKLVFVGEGPGRDEDLQGKPFVGQAGQLLTKIIQAIQLTREEVYIANIIKCRPPGNRNPEPDEIQACEPFLIKQLEVIRPKLICALGTFAAQTLLETGEKISLLRGRFHQYQGIPIMPTYHPAYLLRNPHFKRDVWEDMKKIKKEYEQL